MRNRELIILSDDPTHYDALRKKRKRAKPAGTVWGSRSIAGREGKV